jgi:DNA-binding NtrC family response regulator
MAAPLSQRTVLGLRAASSGGFGEQSFSLVMLNTERAGTSVELSEPFRVGKAPDNEFVIDHPTVSRNHLSIRRQGDKFLVADLGSTNGTFIDGAQIREAFLRPGALLEVGDVQLRLQPQVKSLEVLPAEITQLGDLVGKSTPMRQVFSLLQKISVTESTLLLIGETGSGKGAASRAIHTLSSRATGPLVIFDCAAVSENLIESELFGHERGAFTGAVNQRLGCLERSNGGTLFLDEIDDLPIDLQPKLLRALEDREFRRLGQSGGTNAFDARVLAASKKDLWVETQAGRFREDLFFRLSVFTVTLPPLRDRREDIPLLVNAMAAGPLWERLPEVQREQFLSHTWPGNVRELRNAVERLKHLADIPELASESFLREYPGPQTPQNESIPVDYSGPFKDSKEAMVRAFEREYLTRLLAKTRGNVAKASRTADLDRKHLYSLLHKYNLVSSEGE